jgi:hypothetical protein
MGNIIKSIKLDITDTREKNAKTRLGSFFFKEPDGKDFML